MERTKLMARLLNFVIPAKAGIHLPPHPQAIGWEMGPRFRGDDGGKKAKQADHEGALHQKGLIIEKKRCSQP